MKKLMYILLFLLFAANVAAQEPYVIDSVCVGAVRTYRMNGEKGSTYDWFLKDSLGFQVANPPYTDFRLDNDPNPGDTIWGSEINYVWSVVGEFDIMTLHYSVHGCDTIEQGRVKVFELPEANAGPDLIACTYENVHLSADTAWNARSLEWTTTGDGVFDFTDRLHPVYFRGVNDSINGSVLLILTANGLADNETCTPAIDTMEIIFSNPVLELKPTDLLCYNDSSGTIKANVLEGTAPFDFVWSGPNGYTATGDSISGLAAGMYYVEVTDAKGCITADSVEVFEPDQLLVDIYAEFTEMCENDTLYFEGIAIGGTGKYSHLWMGDGVVNLNAADTVAPGFSGGAPGTWTLIYSATDENGCTAFDTIKVEIIPVVIPLLAEIDTLCEFGEAPLLPPNDLNGIVGTWSPDTISTYIPGTYDFIFTPDSSYICFEVDTVTVVVMPTVIPVLAQIDTICELNIPPALPLTSLNGITGTWSPDTIITNIPGKYNFVFTPDSSYFCYKTDSISIVIKPSVIPVLAEIDTLCIFDIAPPLPPTDLNGIVGTWSPDTIMTDYAGTFRFIFTPDSIYRCFVKDTVWVEVLPIVVPLLPEADTLCELSIAPPLPPTDLNGITGWWSPKTIDTSVPGTYDYVFTPDSSYLCFVSDTMSVIILPNVIPLLAEIDTLCEFDIPPPLPPVDLNGITGWWFPDTISTNVAGTYDFIFTPDSTYICYVPDTVSVTVIPSVVPLLAEIDTLCEFDLAPILPPTDLNGIIGTWLPDTIMTDVPGTYDFIFTPDSSYICFVPDTISVTVMPKIIPLLAEIDTICQFNPPPQLLTTDLNGINGTWFPDTINTNILGTFKYKFIPDSSYICFETDSISVTIIPSVVPVVAPADTFCIYSVAPALPATDLNGIVGTWSPDTIMTDYIGSFRFVFTPDSSYQCFTKDTAFIVIVPPIIPDVPPIGPLCLDDVPPPLPGADASGITGTWWPGTINTSIIGRFAYVFTPDSVYRCFEQDTVYIEIVTPVVANVAPMGPFCQFDVAPLLPSSDLNGINGTWFPDTINTAFVGTFSYVFTPDTALGCIVPDTISVIIVPPVVADVAPIGPLCHNGPAPSLPGTDSNGVTGTWSAATIKTDVVGFFDFIFTPDPAYTCSIPDTLTIEIRGIESVTDLNVCEGSPSFYWETHLINTERDSTYISVLTNGAGCDSTATLNVFILPEVRYQIDTLICASELPFVWFGNSYASEGIYYDTIASGLECDTIWVLDLKVQPENTPLFLPIGPFLENSTPPALPTVSLNNIKGTWSPAVIGTLTTGTQTYTFTPAPGECAVEVTMDITIESGEYWIICPPPLDTLLECDWELAIYPPFGNYKDFEDAGGSAYSSFGLELTSFGVNQFDDKLSCPRTIIRTYEIYDKRNHILSCQQSIVINDKTPPVLSCPPAESVECISDIPPSYRDWFEFVDAGGILNDNCELDLNSFKLVKADTISLAGSKEVRRTYRVKDLCGNEAQCTQTFTVTDFAPPVLVGVPADITVACIGDVPVKPIVTTTENYPVVYTEIVSNWICENKYTITRTWKAKDRCDNEAIDFQVITVNDDIKPEIVCPPMVVFSGDMNEIFGLTGLAYSVTVQDVPLASISKLGISASDNCSVKQITYRDDSTGVCPIIVTRTFTVYDFCGNWNTCTQQIQSAPAVVAMFNPIGPLCLNVPAPPLPDSDPNGIFGTWSPDTIMTDVPGIFEFIFTPDPGFDCVGPDTLYIEISSDIVLTVTTVQDDASIRATGSIDLVVEGGNGPYKYSWSNGGATPKMENLPAGDYFVTVKDANGCIATLTVTVEAEELITEINCPPTITLECNADILVNPPFNDYSEFIAAGGVAFSNCGIDTASFRLVSQDTVPGAFCLNIKRSYSVADSCGTTVTCDQLVVVDDTEPPVLICPDFTSAECLSDVPSGIETIAEFIAAGGTVYDNCALDSASFTFTQIITKVINRTEITTTFSIFDLCGNQSSCDYIVVLNDNIPPLAKCNDITVYLDKFGNYILSEIDIEKISAGSSDNCTLPEDLIIDVEISEFNCDDIESGAEVKVVVTDEAGNSADCTANITILDTIPPEAICRDLVVYLDENGKVQVDIDQINNGSSDNCAIDTMFITPAEFDCFTVGENQVVLTVIDAHSNESVCTATITVIDTISPVVSCVEPFSLQLDTNAHYLLAVEDIRSEVWDECGIDTVYLDRYDLDCEDIGTTIITLTAVDVNGNSASCETEITIIGNIAPNVLNDTVITAFNQAVSVDVAANDYDLKTEIDLTTLLVQVKPQNGIIERVLVNGMANGVLTYTPSPGFIGIDTLTYSICDDAIPCVPMCGTALVYIRVLPENNPPVAVDDYYNASCGPLYGNVMDNDYDGDGFDEIHTNTKPVKLPVHGEVTLQDDGSFTYIPDEGYTGIDSFAYEICDDGAPTLCDTATVYITKLPDNDCDGIPDADDIDDDNDGILDVVEDPTFGVNPPDSDLDGIPDYLDIDSDDDGIVDNIEGQGEGINDYILPTGVDANGNGWDDAYDPEMGGYEFIPVDTDGDGIPDYLDIDSDGDHVFDFIEGHDLNADGIPDVTRVFVDSDHDGLDDIYDTVHGWNGSMDSPNAIGSNAPLQDFDGDGTRDWRDINDEDDEFLTKDEDTNKDGDYSNDDMDLDGYPEYLDKTLDCELFIPEGFSPNDDGVHDFFQILCIQRYPNAHLMIFNRNGNKLFDKHYYGNLDVWGSDADAWWWGNSENRLTLGRAGGLPTGNYVYVIELGNGEVKNGTVMISY